MTWVLVALSAAIGSVVLAMVLVAFDEFRRPPSNVRRAGAILALVVGFASLWLLSTPRQTISGQICAAPLIVFAEFADPPLNQTPGCSAPMRISAGVGLGAALFTPLLVLSTRGRKE